MCNAIAKRCREQEQANKRDYFVDTFLLMLKKFVHGNLVQVGLKFIRLDPAKDVCIQKAICVSLISFYHYIMLLLGGEILAHPQELCFN